MRKPTTGLLSDVFRSFSTHVANAAECTLMFLIFFKCAAGESPSGFDDLDFVPARLAQLPATMFM